ncbi:hypothetical protein [Synechococcus sp. PCC 7336]|nr:hypothetical protein [Synechococcus sp. PCC 7336]
MWSWIWGRSEGAAGHDDSDGSVFGVVADFLAVFDEFGSGPIWT